LLEEKIPKIQPIDKLCTGYSIIVDIGRTDYGLAESGTESLKD